MISVGTRDDERLCEPGRLLSAFMRFVESVRLNCTVKSAAQLSGNGCDDGCGTGFLRGTPFLSAMLAVRLYASAGECEVWYGEVRFLDSRCM